MHSFSHSLFVVPEHSRQKITGEKMVYPYLANTVPALEVSMHTGWPVLITVLIIQASYTIALACGLRVAHFCFDRPLALRARGLSKLSVQPVNHSPLSYNFNIYTLA